MNDEPILHIDMANGTEIDANRDNAFLVLHRLGSTAIKGIEYNNQRFDCVLFLMGDPDAPVTRPMFREQFGEQFEEVAAQMLNTGFQSIIHKKEVSHELGANYMKLLDVRTEQGIAGLDDELNKLLDGDSNHDQG